MAVQGKCLACKVRYHWKIDLPLQVAFCPDCKNGLKMTNSQSHLPKKELTEPPLIYLAY